MRLTIGFATHRDYDGAYFTAQALRLHQSGELAGWLDGVELVIVDNAPSSPEGRALAALAPWMRNDIQTRYIPAPEVTGTSAPRDRVFREATGDVVLCIDSHVMLAPGALDALRRFYERNPYSFDLVQGPLLYDDLVGVATHFADEWRGEMWGVWASNDKILSSAEPVEIPAQGLGLFACQRRAWLGFNPHFREFGGEEFYIHEKYRQAGRRALCLPGLRWLHRFGRPGGITYPLSRGSKIRNYVIGHRELRLPLDRCRRHFVDEIGVRPDEFDAIVGEVDRMLAAESPVVSVPVDATPASGCGCSRKSTPAPSSEPEPVQRVALPVRVADLFAPGQVVVEFAARRGVTFAAALARGVLRLRSTTATTTSEHSARHGRTLVELVPGDPRELEPFPCDLLVIDWPATPDALLEVLERHAPSASRVALVGTAERGEVADDGPGILPVVRRWLASAKDWTAIEHVKQGAGYLILSRLSSDKKELPSTWAQAWNVLGAVARNQTAGVLTGLGPLAGTPTHAERLAECTLCPSRNGDRCGECGCPVERKTSWGAEECPIGRWHAMKGASDDNANK